MQPRYPRAAYLCAPVRTPIGRFGGALADRTAADLGTHAARACLERAGIDPAAVDLTIVGNGRQAGVGPNVARQIAHRAGVPDEIPAYTINQACASSLVGIVQGWQTIALGDADLVLAGGTEAMSQTPYLLPRARWGYRLGHGELVDAMYRDGFLCPLCGDLMGETAETLAERYDIPREEQDRYAAESQRRHGAAREAGKWRAEIAPFPDGELAEDEHAILGGSGPVERLTRSWRSSVSDACAFRRSPRRRVAGGTHPTLGWGFRLAAWRPGSGPSVRRHRPGLSPRAEKMPA